MARAYDARADTMNKQVPEHRRFTVVLIHLDNNQTRLELVEARTETAARVKVARYGHPIVVFKGWHQHEYISWPKG